MAKYVVTGGAGFIGSNIVARLVERGEEVKVVDNFSTGNRKNIQAMLKNINFVEGDILNLDLLKKEFAGYDYVLHQAALPSVPRSIADPITSSNNNIDGTLNVLVAARDSGIKRLVFASSSSVYGNSEKKIKYENLPPNPLSPYALQKLAGEFYCRQFFELYGSETVILRYFNVFGPNQDPNGAYAAAIPKFILAIMNGKRPTIYGDGNQSRDFTYVENVVNANILAATSAKGAGEVMNIACNESITISQVIETINTQLKTNIMPKYGASRPGEVLNSRASIRKAKELIGYAPSVEFKEGIKRTIEYFRSII